MQDHELYRRILGIEAPWQVERVELQLKQGEVHVYLTHQANLEWACAECGRPSPLYDHQAERQWRHLETCQYQTILHAAPPRSQCPEHGIRVMQLPWAVRSRLQPMKDVAAMLKRRFENIITYLRHQITNAASESINATIQWVKYTARGFRNKQNFINAIYFHCGGLDLAPVATK